MFHIFRAVATFITSKVIAVLALIAISLINQTSAECCYPKYVLTHVCLGTPYEDEIPLHGMLGRTDTNDYWIRNTVDTRRPKCVSRFCGDGEAMPGFYCGVGNCNALGCACKGGCRKDSELSIKEMKKIWLNRHGLGSQAKHSA